jgi:myosin-5
VAGGSQEISVSTSKLQPANPDILEGVDDLTKLSYLNEPSVLHDLEYRYLKDQIYVSASSWEPCMLMMAFTESKHREFN